MATNQSRKDDKEGIVNMYEIMIRALLLEICLN